MNLASNLQPSIYKFLFLLYNNKVQKQITSKVSRLFINIKAALFISVFTVTIVACNIISLEPVQVDSTGTGLVFVTVTPSPQTEPIENRLIASPATPEPAARPSLPQANELGQIMILEYHRIGYPEQRFQRTPANFRADLQRLYQAGYYPVNFIDVVEGLPEAPAGKKPIALTFDDSDKSQFHVLADNTIDADSALGILLDFHNQHPQEWPARATFFVLGNDTAHYQSIFGQPHLAEAKIKFLVEAGMEIGSHTANHVDLSVASAERIHWELAISKQVIEALAPGYTVRTLSVPYGGFPHTLDFLKAGQWGEYSYQYSGSAAAWGGPTVSPFDETFDPYKVSRLEVTAESIDQWLTYFEQNSHHYYVSDGDPSRVAKPQPEIASEE